MISATIYEHLLCTRHSAKCRICVDELSSYGFCLHGTSSLVGKTDDWYILKIYNIIFGIQAMKKQMLPGEIMIRDEAQAGKEG